MTEVHLELQNRPVYMVKRMGIFQLWIGYILLLGVCLQLNHRYWIQFFVMVIAFNGLTWLPVLIVVVAADFSSVAFRSFFRIIARPIIGMSLDAFFDTRRQVVFMKFFKPDYGSSANRYVNADCWMVVLLC